jgi:sialate O-acetylesterase
VAVTIDVGDTIIHPPDKKSVGQRLALAARSLVYGEKIEGSSPFYSSMEVQGDAIRIHFSHAEGGLKTSDGKSVIGFEIAGANQKFIVADAVINGSDVVVSSPQILQPVAVRYAWADNPATNLTSSEGLPVGSFRTDHNPH